MPAKVTRLRLATPRSVATGMETRRSVTRSASHSRSESDDNGTLASHPKSKRRKITSESKDAAAKLHTRLFGGNLGTADASQECSLPDRAHSVLYHRPLLLDVALGRKGRDALLAWFDSVDSARSMPWRKFWIDPTTFNSPNELRKTLERRAYEVWISEIMLQQTRVAVVIDYWNRWMARWPTIQDLAAAPADDVVAAWKGLGYYSRATRIHEAAKLVVNHPKMQGLLPEDVAVLEADIPGIGRYTAGAITAIVFGNAEPMVDGNVLRVLSRQLGLLGNVKTDKATIDLLWAAADVLVKTVANDEETNAITETPCKSNRPGRWGQGLMELGSTICTPKPDCAACPITSTCRAYSEGKALAKGTGATSVQIDIEDACTLCETIDAIGDDGADKPSKDVKKPTKKSGQGKQATLASFAFTKVHNSKRAEEEARDKTKKESAATNEAIAEYAKKFPLKVTRKAVREEETLVCAIRRGDGRYLIHRRPQKGLLAGLWEFPSRIMGEGEGETKLQRSNIAQSFVTGLDDIAGRGFLRFVGELGSVPWLFSHLKLTMHVHLFELDDPEANSAPKEEDSGLQARWTDDVDQESMGTGMTKCWLLVKNAADSTNV